MDLVILLLSAFFSIMVEKQAMANGKVIVCYYGSWAVYRPGDGKFDVEQIDPTLCTHLVYAFAGVGQDNKIKVLDPWNEIVDSSGSGKDAFRRFNALKNKSPGLKTLLAVGGWNEGSTGFSQMSADAGRRSTFVTSCVDLLKQYGFDGLDMDWEYPANRGGSAADKGNFVQLLRDLKAAFRPYGFLLTAAVSAGKNTIDTAYDVPGMSQSLDYINVMAYDMHGAFDSYTHHNAPLFALPLDQSHNNQYFNDDFAVRYWLSLGAPKEKLVMGMPIYGRGFTLANPSNNGFYAPTSGAGTAGPYTREAGILGFNEICEIKKQYGDFKRIWNNDIRAPYCTFNSNQWFGYDDTESITQKAQLILNLGLAGGMVWSVETDDFRGKCGLGTNPILNTIKTVLNGQSPNPRPTNAPVPIATTTPTAPRATTARSSKKCSSVGYFASGTCSPSFYYCMLNFNQWIIYNMSCAAGTVYYQGACLWPYSSPECQG